MRNPFLFSVNYNKSNSTQSLTASALSTLLTSRSHHVQGLSLSTLRNAAVCAPNSWHLLLLLGRLLARGLGLGFLGSSLDRKLDFHRSLVNFSHIVLFNSAVSSRCPTVDNSGRTEIGAVLIGVEGCVNHRPTLAEKLLQICLSDNSGVDSTHTELPLSQCALHNAQSSRKLLLLRLLLHHLLLWFGLGCSISLGRAVTQGRLLVSLVTWQLNFSVRLLDTQGVGVTYILVAGLGSSTSRSFVLPQVLQSLAALLPSLIALVLALLIVHGLVSHQAAALVLSLAFGNHAFVVFLLLILLLLGTLLVLLRNRIRSLSHTVLLLASSLAVVSTTTATTWQRSLIAPLVGSGLALATNAS